MRQCAAIWRTARQRRTDAGPHVELRGSTYNCASPWVRGSKRMRGRKTSARQHWCAATYRCAAPWSARHHGETKRPYGRAETCKRYGHEMRGIIRRENQRKQGCAAALAVRGTISNNDVNEAATNEMTRGAATIKKLI